VKGVVRTIQAACLLLLAAACAHIEAPLGGPEMRDPLGVVDVEPDSLRVVPGLRGPVVFEFERRLSERGLDDAVLVSPRTSMVVVGHRGRQLRVSLRDGWQPGQIYQITVLPAVQDLWNNRLNETVTHIFSTGPEIPDTRLVGRARDRITGRPEVDIRVEAIRAPDSLVYATRTDSAGAFVFARIPEGQYQVRAYRDLNRNRMLDPFEPRDTAPAQLAAADPVEVRLSVVMPDTTPPVVTEVQFARQIIQVQFDDYIDPEQALSPAQVQITDPTGAVVPVARLTVGRLEPAPGAAGDAPPAQPAAPAPAQPRDPAAPVEGERLPSQSLEVEPAAPLAPETEYRVQVSDIRNVVGLVGGGEATFTTPAAPAPQPAPATPDAPTTPETPTPPDAPDAPDAPLAREPQVEPDPPPGR
jgi:hypothetical protein